MNLSSLKKRGSSVWKRSVAFFDARPLVTFFGFLGILLVLVVIGSMLRQPEEVAQKKESEPTLVETYTFGESPKMKFSAKIEKSGVISIYAQSPGIVQKISAAEGKRVARGSSIVSLSTTYQGGNVASLSREIAQKSNDATIANFDLQKDIITRQRDLATQGNIQGEELREITRKSLGDTRSLISLNESIISRLDAQRATLVAGNSAGSNDAAILAIDQGKAGALAGLSQLRSTLSSLEYQSDESKIPANLANASKDVTLRQLDLQERGLVLSKELSELNLKIARVSESLMYPASPCAGVVERVYVKVGQSVAPGTLIATINADQSETTAVVLVPQTIATQISRTEESEFLIDGKKVSVTPRYVSTENTDGNLYAVFYSLAAPVSKNLTNNSSIEVLIPMSVKKIQVDTFYVPLDSIYQTQDTSYIYVEAKNESGEETVQSKEISLGEVSGNYVKVTSGLSASDVVIVSRNVQEGQRVRSE